MVFNDNINKEFLRGFMDSDPSSQFDFLTDELKKNEVYFWGDSEKTLLPAYIKPFFLNKASLEKIAYKVKRLESGLKKIVDLYYNGYDFRQVLGQEGILKALSHITPPYKENLVVMRFDCFYYTNTDSFKILEFNCSDPSGMGFNDVLVDIFHDLPGIRQLDTKYRLESTYLLKAHARSLFNIYQKYCDLKNIKPKKEPLICFVCWKDSPVIYDVQIILKRFQSMGYQAVYADPSELKYNKGYVTLNGQEIDIVYRDAVEDFIEPEFHQNCKQILEAYENGDVCLVNPFRSTLADNKSILAIMSDGQYGSLFTEEEREVFRQTIPWTRVFEKDRVERFYDEELEMEVLVKAYKDRFVLKPNEGYGGRNVVLGCTCDKKQWNQLVDDLSESKDKYIVQEFLIIPEDDFPIFIDGKFAGFQKRNVNMNFWVHEGNYSGAFIRAADNQIINVHKDAGMMPVFNVD